MRTINKVSSSSVQNITLMPHLAFSAVVKTHTKFAITKKSIGTEEKTFPRDPEINII
jgi:hypothetical protein